jgi:hypothetical protein
VYTKDRAMRLCGATKSGKPESVLSVLSVMGGADAVEAGDAVFGAMPRDAVITWLDAPEERRVLEPPVAAVATVAGKVAGWVAGATRGSRLAAVSPALARDTFVW